MTVVPSIWTWVGPLLGVMAATVVLVRWGRRAGGGGPIPPTCARCCYDVSRRPAGVDRCSECGADLSRPDAVRTTRPRTRPAVAIPAALAVVLGLPFVGSVVLGFPWKDWVATEAPLRWVIALARRDHSPAGDTYRRAWAAREATPSAAFYDHLLDLQADSAVPRASTWESDLEAACDHGRLTPRQRDRCARQLFAPLTFTVRSPVRPADDLLLEAVAPTARGSAGQLDKRAIFAVRLDGQPVLDLGHSWQIGGLHTVAEQYRETFSARQWCPRGATPGHHRLGLIVSRELVSGGAVHPVPLSAAVIDTVVLDVDVLPATAPLATAAPDPSMAERVARAVDLHVYHWHDGRVFAVVQLLPTAVDRAFRVDAVIDGVDRRVGLLAATAGGEGTTNAVYIPVSPAAAPGLRTLTLVLTGDPDAAAGVIGQAQYWPGRIRYADLPVQPWADYPRDAGNLPQPTTRPFQVQAAE